MAPMTGRAAVLEEFHQSPVIREFPVPTPEPGALVVRVDVASVCGSDIHIWENDLGGTYTLPRPLILGHEVVGIVDQIGAGADVDALGRPLRVGDRVVWANEACGHCETCVVERERTLCANRRLVSLIDCSKPPYFVGAFAEYGYIAPGQLRLRVPDEVDSTWASAGSCALRTVVNTITAAGGIDYMDSVVVQGSGPLGLFATAIASTLGPRQLIVVGAPDDRLALAAEWGATHTISIAESPTPDERLERILEITGRRGPSIALELSGASGAAAEGIAMLQPHGRYVITGTVGGGLQPIDVSRVTTRGLRITGSMSGDIDAYHKAMSFLARHRDRFEWDRMIGRRFGLHQVQEAMEALRTMDDTKPIIDPRITP